MVDRVGVVGLGTMGAGIAITSIVAGHDTVGVEVSQARLDDGLARVGRFLDGSIHRGKMTEEEHEAAKGRLQGTTDLSDLADCDVVVEAIVEDLEAKQALFGELDDICGEETLFATNTSTLSVTQIAAGSRFPGRAIGAHFANPAPLMKLVEVVKGYVTSDDAYLRAMEFVASLGKVPVTTEDTPGFILNLLLVPFSNDCVRALEAGRGTVESIDTAVKQGLGYPMGPFTLLDVVGLDVHRAVSMSLFEQLRIPRAAPPPLVDRMIAAGHLGRKTGRGFYTYETAGMFGD